jgi:hypothetical protein
VPHSPTKRPNVETGTGVPLVTYVAILLRD